MLVSTLLEETTSNHLIYEVFHMAVIINLYKNVKRRRTSIFSFLSLSSVVLFFRFCHFLLTFFQLVLILHRELSVLSKRQDSVARYFVIKLIENYQKKPNQKVTCLIESGNNIL
jgi:hypothetical protein